eukprot:Gb_03033 [translate_table: standard]
MPPPLMSKAAGGLDLIEKLLVPWPTPTEYPDPSPEPRSRDRARFAYAGARSVPSYQVPCSFSAVSIGDPSYYLVGDPRNNSSSRASGGIKALNPYTSWMEMPVVCSRCVLHGREFPWSKRRSQGQALENEAGVHHSCSRVTGSARWKVRIDPGVSLLFELCDSITQGRTVAGRNWLKKRLKDPAGGCWDRSNNPPKLVRFWVLERLTRHASNERCEIDQYEIMIENVSDRIVEMCKLKG